MKLWEASGDGDFVVIRDEEGRHSIWPVALPIPSGWEGLGRPMNKDDCLVFIASQSARSPSTGVAGEQARAS